MFCQTGPSVYQLYSWPKKEPAASWSCRSLVELPGSFAGCVGRRSWQQSRATGTRPWPRLSAAGSGCPIASHPGAAGPVSCEACPPLALYRKARCLHHGVHGGVQMCHASCRRWRGPSMVGVAGGCAAGAPPFTSCLGAESRSPPTACTSSADSDIHAYPSTATTPRTNCFNFYLL